MPPVRTGVGDPVATLRLLWREGEDERRPGPRRRLSVDDVVDTAIRLAGADGVEDLTMRKLAATLGVSTMTLYGYVPGRAELVDLMLDSVYLGMERKPWNARAGWRTRLRRVAQANSELYAAHPWAAGVSTARPPLGPGLMAKYDHELGALEGLGLGDVEMDAALTFVLGFVQSAALARTGASEPGADAEWWRSAGPELARLVDPEAYPLAARVGAAAGAAQDAAFDPDRAFAFGLERVLDGLGALIAARS